LCSAHQHESGVPIHPTQQELPLTSSDRMLAAETEMPAANWRSGGGVPILALLLHAAVVWLARAPGIVMREDDARYLLLARALRAGSYRELWSPGHPLHHMYPPGYPGLLALWTAVGGEGFDWLIVLQLSLSLAILVLTFLTIRRQFPPTVVLWTMGVLALNPNLVFWAGEVSSELSLTLCVAVALWAHTALRDGRARTIILVAAALAAPLFRSAGIILPAALMVEWLITRRWRPALIASILFVLILAPLFWWSLSASSDVPGASYAADAVVRVSAREPLAHVLLRRSITNATWYATRGLTWVLALPTVRGTHLDNVIDSVLVIAALTAGVLLTVRRNRFAVVVMISCSGLLLAWPYYFERFLLPILPLLVAVFLLGVHRLGSWGGPRLAEAGIGVVGITMLIVGGLQDAGRVRDHPNCDRSHGTPDRACLSVRERNFFDGLQFAADSLRPEARLVSANAATVYFHTGHLAVRGLEVHETDSAQFWPRLRELGVFYVLFTGEPRLGERIAEHCRDLTVEHVMGDASYVLRVATPVDQLDANAGAVPKSDSRLSACEAASRSRSILR
jgi:hypothetical protein